MPHRARLTISLCLSGALLGALACSPLRAQSVPLFELPDSSFFPEGLAHDASTGRWFVSSVRHRQILSIARDGTRRRFDHERAPLDAILALAVDPKRKVLWATSAGLPHMVGFTGPDSLRAELLRFSLSDGSLQARYPLPAAERARWPGDLTIGTDGTVYLTDGATARLHILAPGATTMRSVVHPLFKSPQGLVLTPDGSQLLLADYSNGLLLVRLADDSVTQVMTAQGGRARGLDGLAWHGRTLIGTYNGRAPGRVVRISLTEDFRGISDFASLDSLAGPGEPTLGVVSGDEFTFVANSPWGLFDEKGALKPDAVLPRPMIRRLSLRK